MSFEWKAFWDGFYKGTSKGYIIILICVITASLYDLLAESEFSRNLSVVFIVVWLIISQVYIMCLERKVK